MRTLDPTEVFPQFASLSFDAITFEIWGGLLQRCPASRDSPGLVSLENLAARF